jgi:FAD/FMN-containing dehydrogenase
VTATGEVLTANEEHNADLFWALRGGGGNFGVVTSFTFALHPVGPALCGGVTVYPTQDRARALRFFRDATQSLPEELALLASLGHAADGSGSKVASILACHSGAPEDGLRDLQKIKDFASPLVDTLGPITYSAANTLLDAAFPRLARSYWKSSFIDELTDEVIDVLIERFATCPSPLGKLVLENHHGAETRPASDATAFPHRAAGCNLLIIAQWREPQDDDANIAWARETDLAMKPYLKSSVYSNYMDDDEGDSRIRQAFGENFARLQTIKKRYDPENRFHLNQNIPPAE